MTKTVNKRKKKYLFSILILCVLLSCKNILIKNYNAIRLTSFLDPRRERLKLK